MRERFVPHLSRICPVSCFYHQANLFTFEKKNEKDITHIADAHACRFLPESWHIP